MPASHVVVDGSNIATEGRSTPSLKQLDEAVRSFLSERPHDTCIVVVDATFEHRIDPSEKKMYDDALTANELLTPPAGSIGRGDKFILEIADRVDATVFSNDSFQEFHGEYEWLFDEGRLVGGKPVPGVGWVFIERTPVRGPRSRMATRASTRKRARAASGSAVKKAQRSGPATPVEPKAPPVEPKAVEPKPAPAKKKAAPKPPPKAPAKQAAAPEPANQPLPFIEFVAEHQPGSAVEGEVTQFSSHGAYITIGNVRCYAPLKLLGTPAPRSAREVLKRGETRKFVVHAIHAARRGIDLALPEAVQIETPAAKASLAAPVSRNRPSARRGAMAGNTVPEEKPGLPTGTDQAPDVSEAELRESEATLAPAKKGTARKAASKKAAPRKAAARKTAAKKTTARKSTARKSTARKSTAKKSTAKKAAAKKGTARKSAAKKTTAKKRGAAKKATKKKATARKTTARKSTAKKATAKKATRKRTAKKATAKKAPARKRTAKKTTARKTTARKRTTKRASAAKKR